MRISSFDWDESNEAHIAEHGINIFEVEEAILFSRPFYQRSRDGRYAAYAVAENGRHLFIIFMLKGSSRIRVISARGMSEKEKHYYRKRKGIG